ncbi:WD domain-containing protein [Aphelenchoides avenae]|nr:WD domain-containing protein [Aphelenchus avenae]
MTSARIPSRLLTSFDCKQGAIRAARFNVDGNYCITCGSDKTVRLWNPYRQVHLKSYTGLGSEPLDAAGSSDNAQILAGGRDKQPTIFDVETGKMLKRWQGHGGAINAVAFNEDSGVAISASQDGTVRCWDARSRGPPIQVLDEATDSVLCLDVGAYEIATGSADGHARIYDIREGRMFLDFHGDSVTSVHLTSDNQCLLTSCMDGHIRLLEKINGQMLAEYVGHRNRDYRIESGILASNNEVVSGSEDGFVYLWDVVDAKVLHKLDHSPVKYVHSVSTHPTKQGLVSVAREKIYIWQCPQEDEEEGDAAPE